MTLAVSAMLVFGMALVALVRPWLGVLAYAWVSLMFPQRLLGGEVYDFPVARVLAAATLVGLLLTRQRHRLPVVRELWLVATFWLVCLASTVFTAFEPERAWKYLGEFTKVLIMLVPAVLLLQDARRLRLWLTTIALSLGSLGVLTGVRAIATGLSERQFGPSGSTLGDNNALGFALAMAVPLLAFLARSEARAWLRAWLLGSLVLTLVALPSTYSRGTMIVVGCVLPLTLLMVRDLRVRVLNLLTIILIAWFTPEPLEQRMATIRPNVYREDSSGAERMKSWYVALRIGLDYPVLGAGFRPFSEDVYERYIPGYRDYHNAHNHFLQVFAEQGFTGLSLFVAMLVSALLRLRAVALRTRGDPARAWVADYARMLALSLLAYIVGGAFLNLPYFELLYWLFLAAVLLEVVAASPAAVGTPVVGESILAALWRRLRGST